MSLKHKTEATSVVFHVKIGRADHSGPLNLTTPAISCYRVDDDDEPVEGCLSEESTDLVATLIEAADKYAGEPPAQGELFKLVGHPKGATQSVYASAEAN